MQVMRKKLVLYTRTWEICALGRRQSCVPARISDHTRQGMRIYACVDANLYVAKNSITMARAHVAEIELVAGFQF